MEENIKKLFFIRNITILCLILLISGCGSKASFIEEKEDKNYANDFKFVEVADPSSGKNKKYTLISKNVPAAGRTFKDKYFKTLITRVTKRSGIRHEYSRHDPFNSDHSLIMLHFPLTGETRVYRTKLIPYEKKENLVIGLELEEPRWDSENPYLVWGFSGFKIIRLNVNNGKEEVIKDFSKDKKIKPLLENEPDLFQISMQDEGESSKDKNYWAFAIQGSNDDYRLRYLISWDRKNDKILGIYKVPKSQAAIDWVGMSTKGNWVLIGVDAENGKNLTGLTLANKELTKFHRLDYTVAHSDIGLDIEGNEVIVMQNTKTDYIDMIPLEWQTKPILNEGQSYKGTKRIPLVRLYYNSDSPYGFNSGIHISCNYPGYAVISTFIEPGLKEKNWLDRSIILVKLDRERPRVFYLAKVYNTTQEYWEETQASISSDGSKIVWASNWNQYVGKEQVLLMQLDLIEGWPELIK